MSSVYIRLQLATGEVLYVDVHSYCALPPEAIAGSRVRFAPKEEAAKWFGTEDEA